MHYVVCYFLLPVRVISILLFNQELKIPFALTHVFLLSSGIAILRKGGKDSNFSNMFCLSQFLL